MKTWLALASLLTALTYTGCTPVRPEPPPRALARLVTPVSLCGAILVGDGRGLTAAHCALDAETEDDISDLAVLAVKNPSRAITIGPLPAVGDMLVLEHFPRGNYARSYGYVDHIQPQFYHRDEFTILGAGIEHGSSGGGAFDAKGRLVGIITRLDVTGRGYLSGPASINLVLSGDFD